MWNEAQEDRRDQARRRLGGGDPACACGENDPLALTGVPPDIRCYECDRAARGLPVIEQQHPQGKANGPQTVPVPGNDHRIVDALKADWPVETLRNPSGNPLLKASACVRSWLDTLQLILERTVGWVPDFLERLNRWLESKFDGPWWDEFNGWEQP